MLSKPIYSEEAEKAVLGACMVSTEALSTALEVVKPDMFYHPAHKVIFKAIVALVNENQPVDLITVTDKLGSNLIKRVGGASYIASLGASLEFWTGNTEQYANIVKEKWVRRVMFEVGRKIANMAADEHGDVAQQLSEAEKLLLSTTTAKSTVELWGNIVADRWDYLYATRDQDNVGGVLTGFADLDRITGGLQRKDLVVLAARPSQGKTTLAQNIAENVAKKMGVVLFFSLEMKKEGIIDRAISASAGIDGLKLRTRMMSNEDWDKGQKAISKIAGYPIWIDDDAFVTTLDIRSRARRIKAKYGLDLVVIDYLQLIKDDANGMSRNEIVGAMAQYLQGLAKELDAPILLLSQMSRAVEHRQDKTPVLADLRESGGIEQAADVVIFIHCPDENKLEERELIIAKHRNGPTGRVPIYFDRKHVRFRNICQHV